MNLDEARAIVAAEDATDPVLALEAIATVLRFHAIADQRIVGIAKQIEDVAEQERSNG